MQRCETVRTTMFALATKLSMSARRNILRASKSRSHNAAAWRTRFLLRWRRIWGLLRLKIDIRLICFTSRLLRGVVHPHTVETLFVRGLRRVHVGRLRGRLLLLCWLRLLSHGSFEAVRLLPFFLLLFDNRRLLWRRINWWSLLCLCFFCSLSWAVWWNRKLQSIKYCFGIFRVFEFAIIFGGFCHVPETSSHAFWSQCLMTILYCVSILTALATFFEWAW
mmetsp:Transcript_102660/g.162238  ORF Transcript_102660/g.162238 Transcript_102660/m.162238 type:complete len:221 (+) Transcript_102660:114-776(+)